MTAKKRASGPTQPENERRRKQVLLRLTDEERDKLDNVANSCGMNRSVTVMLLVERELTSDAPG
jgi:hypothetical protein